MDCKNCGTALNSDDMFCPSCGTQVVNPVAPVPGSLPEWTEPAEEVTTPQKRTAKRSQARNEIMGIGEVMVMFLLQAIPVIGLILTFVWAFGNVKKMRKNIAAAQLLLILIGIGIYAILFNNMNYDILDRLFDLLSM